MARRAPLSVHGPVSSTLIASLPRAQSLLESWNVGLRRVPVDAEPDPSAVVERTSGVGCFFSGGVDSFYTALKHLDEITGLIFVHGFDISMDRAARREEVAAGVRQAAQALGKQLVEVETDVRPFLTRHVRWRYSHGAAMASVALALSPTFGKVFIPASHTVAEGPPPYGSHPALDPLWGTERLEIVYDGLEASRLDKVAAIKDDPTAMRWLRVCQNRTWEGGYNCGSCEKCVRALIYLSMAGAVERCSAFPSRLDPAVVASVEVDPPDMIGYWQQDLRALEALQGPTALVAAVRHAVGKAERKQRLVRRIHRRAARVLRRRRPPVERAGVGTP
jgi:hypothetical protein